MYPVCFVYCVWCMCNFLNFILCTCTIYNYQPGSEGIYWFQKSIVFVNWCLVDGWFWWTTILVRFLPYVFNLRLIYFLATILNKEDGWSDSIPNLCSKEMAWNIIENVWPKLCKHSMLYLQVQVLFRIYTHVLANNSTSEYMFQWLLLFLTLQQMGILDPLVVWKLWTLQILDRMRYGEGWESSGSSRSSALQLAHCNLARRDHTMNPDT